MPLWKSSPVYEKPLINEVDQDPGDLYSHCNRGLGGYIGHSSFTTITLEEEKL